MFKLQERLARLRQMSGYFKSAAVLTGDEIRTMLPNDPAAHKEWFGLLADMRACLHAMEAIGLETAAIESSRKVSIQNATGRTLH